VDCRSNHYYPEPPQSSPWYYTSLLTFTHCQYASLQTNIKVDVLVCLGYRFQ
jgi:hypothetical protein